MKSLLGFPDDIRLACQTKVSGDIRIRRLVVDDLDTHIISDQLARHADSLRHF